MNLWQQILEFATATTDRVGERLLADFGRVEGEEKGDGSLVTAADKWADAEIRKAIESEFPDWGILSEEGNHTFPRTDWTWVIDPLDGTTNFTRGIPLWGIVLGLLYKGHPVFGCVYFPPLNRRFHGYWVGDSGLTPDLAADMPAGACLNGKPIRSSDEDPSGNHFFSFCARSLKVYRPGFPCKVRMLGVASYNFLAVADGTMLGGVEATPKIWDFAGVWPIIHAAGAAWVSLLDVPIFPAQIDRDYGSVALTSFVISRSHLADTFEPWLTELKT
jgi:myo-inositol-1(or 4)-monophosphatase